MNTREIAAAYRLSQWAKELQARVANGESVKDFCRRKGVSRNTYFYWQRKLREAACHELAVKSSDKLVPSGWALCEVAEPKSSPKILPIEIGCCRVMADAEVDPELLAKVCKVLVSLC